MELEAEEIRITLLHSSRHSITQDDDNDPPELPVIISRAGCSFRTLQDKNCGIVEAAIRRIRQRRDKLQLQSGFV
jgi:hypothetical protein